MIAFNNKQIAILVLVVVSLLAFLAYGNFSKKYLIDHHVHNAEKQEGYIKNTVNKYQDCLRMSQEWSSKYDTEHKNADDLKSRLDSAEADRKKAEAQLNEALRAAKSRVELLEGQVKSLTAQKANEAPAEEAKEAREVAQSLRHELAELQQRLKAAVAGGGEVASAAVKSAGTADKSAAAAAPKDGNTPTATRKLPASSAAPTGKAD